MEDPKKRAVEGFKKRYCEPHRVPPQRCEEMTEKMIRSQERILKNEGECGICKVVETFCKALPGEGKGACKKIFDDILDRKITAEQGKKMLEEKIPGEELARARETVRSLLPEKPPE